MFELIADLIDTVTDLFDGSSAQEAVTDVSHTGGPGSSGGQSGDVKFGNSSEPVCWWCGGSGTSVYPSSGTTTICSHCGGSGH
ncbi:MAG: hypothetical protein ACRDRX_25570 [Pseudonocardiaceae bacterium]